MPNHFTVIFLQDTPLTQLVILERGADRRFAPNRFTGIGGKLEKGESPLKCAVRELREETGMTGIELCEFGRLVVRRTGQVEVVHYFTGWDDGRQLPTCSEGRLHRVLLPEVLTRNIIPTTKLFVERWAARCWNTGRPFTLVIEQSGTTLDDPIHSQRLVEGLNGFVDEPIG